MTEDKESKAFQLLFGNVMDTEALTETLGGLGDWEEYLKRLKKRRNDEDQHERKQNKRMFDQQRKDAAERRAKREKSMVVAA